MNGKQQIDPQSNKPCPIIANIPYYFKGSLCAPSTQPS